MARIEQNQFEEQGVNPFNAPIPGESLTSSPENPKAWERPPEFTNEDDAMKALYLLLTEQDKLKVLVDTIDEGVAIDEIAQVILYKGYTEGKYNPDIQIPEDDITPIDMDGDGIPDKVAPSKEIKKPEEDSVSASLLQRIKTELPGKIKEATSGEEKV